MKKENTKVRISKSIRKIFKFLEADTSHGYVARKIWPKNYVASPPLRYFDNFETYANLGGVINPIVDVVSYVKNSKINEQDAARFFSFCLIYDQIQKEHINGDFAELGVYKGNTASVLANLARKSNRTLYLLDTFEGFSNLDLGLNDECNELHFTDTSIDSVRNFVGSSNVTFIKGRFPETVELLPDDNKFALVHIDCDLYAPILAGLEYFYPKMIRGGFIIIHDYSSLYWRGAEKAVDEFFSDKPEFLIPMPDWSGSAIIRKI